MIQKPLFSPQVEWTPPEEFKDLSKYDEIAIDLETKDPELKTMGSGSVTGRGRIVGIALAVEDWSGYYPIAHEGGGNMDEKKVMDYFRTVLNYPSRKIFHNAMYDVCFIRAAGLQIAGDIVDTMIAGSLVDENRFRYDLGSMGRDYLGKGKNEAILTETAREWGVDAKSEKRHGDAEIPLSLLVRAAGCHRVFGAVPGADSRVFLVQSDAVGPVLGRVHRPGELPAIPA